MRGDARACDVSSALDRRGARAVGQQEGADPRKHRPREAAAGCDRGQCEEFFVSLQVGDQDPDGHLEHLRVVRLNDEDHGRPLPVPGSFAWSVDGKYLLASGNRSSGPVVESRPGVVLRVDPATGDITRLFETGFEVSRVGQLADGTYVVAGNAQVTLRDGKGTVRAVDGDGFEIAPDGRRIAVFGRELVLVTPGDSGSDTLVPKGPEAPIVSADFSPDGRAIAYLRPRHEDDRISVVTISNARITPIAEHGRFGQPIFAGDGRALAFTDFGAAPDFVPRITLVRFQ